MRRPQKMILLDLENCGTRALQSSMGVLNEVCEKASVQLRTYTAAHHSLARLATTTVESSARNAVDVRIAFDIGRTSLQAGPGSRFLVVTKDLFGKALADFKGASTDHVTLETPLPRHWRHILGVPSLGRLVDDAVRARAAEAAHGSVAEPGVSHNLKHCFVCGVTVTTTAEMRSHLAGKKHARREARLRDATRKLRPR